ncbi:hypothetical protein Pmani_021770 [Petrolisthes manimaculis]|uniref:Uncharacterized protein n=1 Tax=Petrolisthes manimaculis TaxID=1843537 RepID=A0AAE1PD45_9EUCA|nr:hypothetical protein Pmani_021770 [Petrolisthes manimaculis]
MGKKKDLTSDQISSRTKKKDLTSDQISSRTIVSLHKAKQSVKEITKIVGVSERTVRNWVAKFKSSGGIQTPAKKKTPGMVKKISLRIRNVITWQIDADPHITSRVLNEKITSIVGKCISKNRWWMPAMTTLVTTGAVHGLNPTSLITR